jgi:hypothetical protein
MRPPHAQIHLPPLDAGYALTLVDIFERAIDAIWRAHGHSMAELQALRADAARSRPPSQIRPHDPDGHLF